MGSTQVSGENMRSHPSLAITSKTSLTSTSQSCLASIFQISLGINENVRTQTSQVYYKIEKK